MPDRIKLLVAESETPDARARRRNGTGRSSAETFAATLAQLEPGAQIDLARPAEDGAPEWTADDLARFDGIVLSGSPLHGWQDDPMVRRHLRRPRRHPARADLLWQLGTDEQVADPARRTLELRNFLAHLVRPTRQTRRRKHLAPA